MKRSIVFSFLLVLLASSIFASTKAIMNLKKINLFFVCCIFVMTSYSQNNSYIGVVSSFEKNADNTSYLYGLNLEKEISAIWSFETGLALKNYVYPSVNVRMRFANIPLFIKFDCRYMNVSLGLNSYFYTGWDYISTIVYPATVSFDLFKLSYGAKLSKNIPLNNCLNLEPQLTLNLFNPVNYNNFDFGLGLSLKYKL